MSGPEVDFETLYRRYAADVYRFALFLTGRPEQADDIAAQTFVRAWMSPDGARDREVSPLCSGDAGGDRARDWRSGLLAGLRLAHPISAAPGGFHQGVNVTQVLEI